MKPLNHLPLVISIILLLSSCQKSDTKRIAILHTNDTHGKIVNFDKLNYLKDSLLAIYDTVLLVSAGDMFSGNPYVDNYKEKGFPMVDLMNSVKYSIAAVGNHEFDYGQEILEERMKQAKFPFIVGNISADSGFFSSLKASYSINIKGVDLKFVSLIETQNNGKPSTHPKRVLGLEFSEPIAQTQQILNTISNYDALIGLTHIGFDDDSILSIKYPQFDAIIGGHSHTLIKEQKIINNVLIAQAGENLEHAGLIVLSFNNNKLVNKSYKLIDFETLPAQNNELTEKIDSYRENDYLDEVLAKASTKLKDRKEIACLFTDAQLNYHDVDMVFQNYWGIRVNHLAAGSITRKDILELDPFNNELLIYTMTIPEIKSLIEYSYYLSKSIDLFIAGGTYEIETNNADSLTGINIYNEKGKLFDETKSYQVGINSYVTRSYRYSCKDSGKSSNTTTSENIIRYLQDVKEIDYRGCNRVTIVKKRQ